MCTIFYASALRDQARYRVFPRAFAPTIKSVRYVTRMKVGARPRLVPLLRIGRWSYGGLMVRPGTGVCIDGFPRSANTYATTIFGQRNAGVTVAHHMHVPGQILRAMKLGIPCALLIRPPVASITSMLAIDSRLPLEIAVWSYIDFYRRAWPARDSVVLCRFDEIVSDAGILSRRLNARFGTDFDGRPVDHAERARVLGELDAFSEAHPGLSPWTATPDAAPEKAERRARLEERLQRHPRLAEAERWYERWTSL